MSESTNDEFATLKADFAALNQTVSHLSHDVKSLLSAVMKDSEDKAKSSVDDSFAALRRRFDEMRGRGHQYVDTAEQQISEHPYTSLLTAFAVGFVLAKLLDVGRPR